MRRVARKTLPLFAAVVALSGCADDQRIALVFDGYDIDLTADFDGGFEAAVLSQASCPALADFLALDANAADLLFHAAGTWQSRSSLQDVGELPNRVLSFAAVLRDPCCAAVAYGCRNVSPASAGGAIVVSLASAEPPIACDFACVNSVCDQSGRSDGGACTE